MERPRAVEEVASEVAGRLERLEEDERARRMRDLLAAAADPRFHVIVFGVFNRGKSTLINALLGRAVLSARLIPTTGQITRIAWGEPEGVRILLHGGGTERCGLEELNAVASLRPDGGFREDVESVEVGVTHPLIRDGMVLTDTPGLNEAETQTRRSLEAIRGADVVLFVLDARQLLDVNERRLSFEWLTEELDKPVVPVINFMNFLSGDEAVSVRGRLEHWCGPPAADPFALRWYEVDALGALRHALDRGPAPADDFAALRASLLACHGEVRAALQRRSRTGALAAELAQVRLENGEKLERLRTAAEEAARAREEAKRQRSHARARLTTATGTQREHLRLFARQVLHEELESLTGYWFGGESRSRLDQHASDWYRHRLSHAVETIETEANRVLLALADEGLSRPEPVSIEDGVDLELTPPAEEADAPVGKGAGLGAIVGTLLLPGAGTLLGALWGGALAASNHAARQDPVGAFSAAARDSWADAAESVVVLLQERFDAQGRQWLAELDRRLVEHPDPGHSTDPELAARAALDECLSHSR
jgi:GTPase SAR1 family protein